MRSTLVTAESSNEAKSNGKPRKLPCRILVKARGVEWFIYNRSPAYDAVLQSMQDGDQTKDEKHCPTTCNDDTIRQCHSDKVSDERPQSIFDELNKEYSKSDGNSDREGLSRVTTTSTVGDADLSQNSLPGVLNILPIGVECSKGAIVMGNKNTRSILTAKFDSAAGKIDVRPSRPIDQYKQTFDFEFVHPIIQFKHNKDYTEPQLKEGAKLFSGSSQVPYHKPQKAEHVQHPQKFHHILDSIRDFIPYRRRSFESLNRPRPKSARVPSIVDDDAGAYSQNRWLGLSRYLDDEDDDLLEQERWKSIEYGQFSTIVDSPIISMSFYWDVPGLVPDSTNTAPKPLAAISTDINGCAPPDWGIDLRIGGGTIHYGPWADRQRADLQAVFFPPLYNDATAATKLVPGQQRVSSILKIVVDVEEQITIRIPTREASKDWKWKGHKTQLPSDSNDKKAKNHGKGSKSRKSSQTPEVRQPGWLEMKLFPDSTINFSMDLLANSNGYTNRVDIDLKGGEMSSSVNHGLLWRTKSQLISCDLSNPLGWNSPRHWRIDIHDDRMELFILRDHMFLLNDLINDWVSGPPADFYTFVPFKYSISFHLADFRLYLNANDSNIINNPSDFEDNTFIIVWGTELKANLVVPSTTFRPARNQISFDVEAVDGGLELHTPPRNTQHAFLNDSHLASLKDLRINGSYNYFTSTTPNLTDILLMDVYGLSLRVELYGFLIRYIMKIKDNYFGDDIHFRTLDEYRQQVNRNGEHNVDDGTSTQHSRFTNDLDVIIGIKAEDLCALLPAHLYSSTENVRLEILSVTGDLRITNYYMDLAVSSAPIAVSYSSQTESKQDIDVTCSSTQLFIDGLEIFGHRLFGLPPTEPTYVCNWDFDVSTVTGQCSIEFLRCFTMSIRCFVLTFDDAENALPPLNPTTTHDVTFVRARLQPLFIGLRVEQVGFLLSTGQVEIDFDDWAGELFSNRLHLTIPNLALAVTDAHEASSNRENVQIASDTHAYLKTTIELNGVSRKNDLKQGSDLQQSHVALHDTRTHRTPWLIRQPHLNHASGPAPPLLKLKPPAMPYPLMPEPVNVQDTFTIDSTSSKSGSIGSASSRTSSNAKNSFLVDVASHKDVLISVHTKPRSVFNLKQSDTSVISAKIIEPFGSSTHRDSAIKPNAETSYPLNRKVPPRFDPTCIDLSFSSPYEKPYFPLLATKADMRELPCVPDCLECDSLISDTGGLEGLKSRVSNEAIGQSNFMINLSPGVQTFCTPKALFLVIETSARLQGSNFISLLDELQIDVLTDILAGEERSNEATTANVRIYVPRVAARFVNTAPDRSSRTSRQERYELILDGLTVTAMSSNRPSLNPVSDNAPKFSLHLSLKSINCSARESMKEGQDDQAVVNLSVADPTLWMLYGTRSAAEMHFAKLEVVSASRKIDYISSLIRQTLLLSENLARSIQRVKEERKSRMRLFVSLLTTEGDGVPDPPFLTRASYVLPSASYHIRTSDSWKIMSRLRYIYRRLPEWTLNQIRHQCVYDFASCPQNAGQCVIANLEQRQTCGLANVKSSRLIQKVYGELLNPPVPAFDIKTPFRAIISAGIIQVIVEPGPEQNEAAIKGLIVGLAVNEHPPTLAPLMDSSNPKTSTIQAHCTETTLRVNWSLLTFLENIVNIVQARENTTSAGAVAPRVPNTMLDPHRLHIVISSEMNVLNCETPNVRVVSVCQGLKVSLITLQDSRQSQEPSMTILINANTTTSKVKTHSTTLSLYRLREPKIFMVREINSHDGADSYWKIVATGQEVIFQVFANPLQILEAADAFMEQEVARIFKWVKSLRPASLPAQPRASEPQRTGLLKAQITLFLDSYLLSLRVLPSLTYQITGTGAHTLAKSGLQGGHDLVIVLGLNKHSHVFQTIRDDKEISSVLSTLRMPPIDAKLKLDLTPSRKVVQFDALIESIVFDASAVHAILAAINRPEIVSLGSSISYEVSILKEHSEAIFDNVEKDQRQPFEPILYNADVALASIAVNARTSESLTAIKGAELQFKVNTLHLKATNETAGTEGPIRFPELEIQVKGIDLNLLRFEGLNLLPCGNVALKALLRSTSQFSDARELVRSYQVKSSSLQVNIYAETAPVVVTILGHLQDSLKTVDLSQEVQNLKRLGRSRLRSETPYPDTTHTRRNRTGSDGGTIALFGAMYSLEMTNICIIWRIGNSAPISPRREPEDLILSFTKIDLATKRENAARLLIENFQLQMTSASKTSTIRSLNSAHLPEVVFNVAYVSTYQDRRLAFQVAGKSLDLQLTSHFILPANDLRHSIALSVQQVRTATADRMASATMTDGQTKRLLGNKQLASLLVDADFAGAVVHVQGRRVTDPHSLALSVLRGGRGPQHTRYNQDPPEALSNSSTTLRAPGIAFKIEFKNAGPKERSLNAEMKVDASSNILYPTVVPLIMEISSTVKEIVGDSSEQEKGKRPGMPQRKFLEDERLRGADPSNIFENCKLNLGLRICRQEFSLSCQPIARVAATAHFDDIYITFNTVQSNDHGKFFTVSGACTRLQLSVQHVYSRESTGSLMVESIVVSLMNSKHVSIDSGISAILNISPMKAQINGKQSQDFLLFREIWVPPEMRGSASTSPPVPASESQAFIVQRYQQISATGAFPWNTTIYIAELDVQVDLGQSLGRSTFVISKFWTSSRKTSDWEQNLCLGFEKMAVDSSGRMSGFVELQNLRVRTSIKWPVAESTRIQTPLVQASMAFDHLRVKAAFDYQAFAIADITTSEFLMYNTRDPADDSRDRLVGILSGGKVQVFCTTTSASQVIALHQAFQRLYQEKLAAYQTSLQDIERYLHRKSSINPSAMNAATRRQEQRSVEAIESALKLQTDVVVALKAVNIGAFPSTFFDSQVFKLEALDASARFGAVLDGEQIHCTLGMTLGQLRIALADITRGSTPKALSEVSVADVVATAIGSRGGTILKVPRLVATMETWQTPASVNIDYTFKSSFQGKVDVGWNYSRISYIRGMWTNHERALAQRLGKPLPQAAVQIKGGPHPRGEEDKTQTEEERGKITAVVNVPQSKYHYKALQPPIIETPQLRDMGEATPPLEWIGLHREKLPNLTHQIVIVALLEVAKEVDDAYSRILGSS